MSGVQRGFTLDLSCAFDAPRERIFTALTEPAELVEWWGPSGFTTPEIEVDLNVGGGYRFGMQPPDGELFHLAGEFLEIEPPSWLAYTFRWEEPDPDDRETIVRLSLRPAPVDSLSYRCRRASSLPRHAGRCTRPAGRIPWKDCPHTSIQEPEAKGHPRLSSELKPRCHW